MKTKDLITEVIDLPIEERAMVVDSILKSLNPTQSDIDKKWAAVAKQRLKELRSGEGRGHSRRRRLSKDVGKISLVRWSEGFPMESCMQKMERSFSLLL